MNVPQFQIRLEREDDGRWLAIVDAIPGVMAYGSTRQRALTAVKALTLRVVADRLEHGEKVPEPTNAIFRSRVRRWSATRARREKQGLVA